MNQILTVVICTRNRSDILSYCLESITDQSVPTECYNIIVVDNASTDDTVKVIRQFQAKSTNIEYGFVEKVGLSNARNFGFEISKTGWITYLDDDAMAHKNFVEAILRVIENYPFACFGGVYLPWFKYGKKYWLPYEVGTNKSTQNTVGALPDGKYASGGNFSIRKQVLEEVGGFNLNLGMSGAKISYGEEVELQIRLRERGYQVGFDPNILIDHLVPKRKLQFSWWVKSYFAQGRDAVSIFGQKPPNLLNFLLRSIASGGRALLVGFKKLFVVNDYTIASLFYDVTYEVTVLYGMYASGCAKRR
ncbi:MAG: glycosyltransferase family 2 protein [Imperialibacter sp.]|uniref:glycosyltransferase n=1 Tax=Imperialibacter sp. TaxID=2038411 RepID=UPI0032EE9028